MCWNIGSGVTHHFHEIDSTNLPQQPTSNYNPEARVIVPNGASKLSSSTAYISITYLPPSATKSHGFNHIVCGSLFSVGQACDNNCTAVFDTNSVKMSKSTEVSINALHTFIIQGHHNAPSQPIYSVYLPY